MSMRFLVIALVSFASGLYACTPAEETPSQDGKTAVQKLAAQLTKYYVGVFVHGPEWNQDADAMLEEAQEQDRQRIRELVAAGKLVGAVEVERNAEPKMVVFLKTDSQSEAWSLMNESPAVKSKFYDAQVYEVWGTRGLGTQLEGKLPEGEEATKSQYYLVVGRKGANWVAEPGEDTKKAAEIHSGNVLKLHEEGTLKFFAAFSGSGDPRNMAIVTAGSQEAVEGMLAGGEAVKAGWLSYSVYPCLILDGVLP